MTFTNQSCNFAQETFISADDLRVNLWHLDVTDQCFTIVDIKPPNMEDLTEVRVSLLSKASIAHTKRQDATQVRKDWIVEMLLGQTTFICTRNTALPNVADCKQRPELRQQRIPCMRQVITSADFHPESCSIFAFSSSKGCIRLADMRESALCDGHSKAFEETEPQVRHDVHCALPACRGFAPNGALEVTQACQRPGGRLSG